MPSGRSGIFFKAGEGDVEMIINANVDVLDELSNNQRQQLADELYDLGFIPKQIGVTVTPNADSDFDKLVGKIIGNKHRLTIDEERIICEIAEKIVL